MGEGGRGTLSGLDKVFGLRIAKSKYLIIYSKDEEEASRFSQHAWQPLANPLPRPTPQHYQTWQYRQIVRYRFSNPWLVIHLVIPSISIYTIIID